jgi:hypothetical protein
MTVRKPFLRAGKKSSSPGRLSKTKWVAREMRMCRNWRFGGLVAMTL